MSEPRINAQLLSQRNLLSISPQRVLLINTSDTATPGLYTDIPNDNSWFDVFGESDFLTRDIDAFKAINRKTPLDVISVAPGTGAPIGDLTVVGSATSDGEISVSLGSSVNDTYTVAIVIGQTPTDIAAALSAAINLDTRGLVSAVPAVGVITLTVKNLGIQGNDLNIKSTTDSAGVSIVMTAFTGGLAAPSLTSVLDPVSGIRYQTVCAPFEWGTDFLTDFLDPRFNVENDILDGVGFVTATNSLSNHLATVGAINSQSLVYFATDIFSDPARYIGSSIFELNSAISASFAAIRSLRLTEGADISEIVTNNQPNDQVGGPAIASLPYANTPFVTLPLIDRDKVWALDDEESLNAAGATIFDNNKGFTDLVVNRVVTTYKTDTLGLEDKTFEFLNAVDTSSEVREFYFDAFKANFSQTRLTLGNVIANRSMVNANAIRAFCVTVYQELGDVDFVLVQNSQDDIAKYKKNLTVSIEDLQQGRVRVAMRIVPLSQLRTIDMPIEVVFTTQ